MEKVAYNLDLKGIYKNLKIYKRSGRTFYFRNKHVNFHIDLHDKQLFEMVEKYNVGDFINLSE